MSDNVVITLMTRAHCSLCEEMVAALRSWAGERFTLQIDPVDIERDPALKRRYGTRIPVLLHEGRELCAGRFDAARVERLIGDA